MSTAPRGSRSSNDPDSTATLGRTKVTVTRLGFGTGPLGGWPDAVPDEEAAATIVAAWDVGIRYFDTAPLYGYGTSETRLGEALRERPRSSFTLSTKVGRLLREPAEGLRMDPAGSTAFKVPDRSVRPAFDFSYDGTMRSLEESLSRLGFSRADILLIHDPDNHMKEAAGGAYRALDKLRSEGVIGAVGVGMNRTKGLIGLVERLDLDCVMLAGRYTLLDQSSLEDFMPLVIRRGVSVLAAGVYNSGILAKPTAQATYNYAKPPPELVERTRRLSDIAAAHRVPLAAAALQLPLGHPAVAAVVIGARSAARVRENAMLMRTRIPRAFWEELRHESLLREGVPTPD